MLRIGAKKRHGGFAIEKNEGFAANATEPELTAPVRVPGAGTTPRFPGIAEEQILAEQQPVYTDLHKTSRGTSP